MPRIHDGVQMPRKKTKKSVAKRFKVTANGKVKYAHAGSGHLLACKTRKRKRNLRRAALLSKPEAVRVKAMLAS